MIRNAEIVKVAFRNVLRNRKRTILTVLAIVIGIFAFIMSNTVVGGIDETTIRNTLDAETAHVKIYRTDYFPDRKEMNLDYLIADPEKIMEKTRSLGSGISAAPRLKFRGSVALTSEDMPCVIYGIDPDRDGKVFNILSSIVEGNGVTKTLAEKNFREGKKTCLIGLKFADLIGVLPGDEVLLSGRTMHGAYNADSFTVAGLVASDNPVIDAFAVILPLSEAVQFADTGGAVSEIAVKTPSRGERDVEVVLKGIGSMLPSGLQAHPWYEEMADVLNVFKLRRVVLVLIIGLLLVIAVAGITNTMLIAVMERTREIGTMAAMGMKKRQLTLLFLYEGTMIGLMGGLLAALLTVGPLLFITIVGVPMEGSEMLANVPISSRLYGRLEWFYVPLAVLIATAVSALASVYPARKAAGMNIAETLRRG